MGFLCINSLKKKEKDSWYLNQCLVSDSFPYIAEPLYNGHLRTGLSGRCREVAVMGRFVNEKLGQENIVVVERWPLWGVRL